MNETKQESKLPENPEGHPLFVSTTGQPVMLALLSGHSASVGVEPTPLHPRFHRAAVIKGVVPVGMRGSIHREEEQGAMPDRQALLLKCVADMVSAADADPTLTPKLFTNDGRPDAREMAVRLGFPVKADERDAAWNAYTDGDKD